MSCNNSYSSFSQLILRLLSEEKETTSHIQHKARNAEIILHLKTIPAPKLPCLWLKPPARLLLSQGFSPSPYSPRPTNHHLPPPLFSSQLPSSAPNTIESKTRHQRKLECRRDTQWHKSCTPCAYKQVDVHQNSCKQKPTPEILPNIKIRTEIWT